MNFAAGYVYDKRAKGRVDSRRRKASKSRDVSESRTKWDREDSEAEASPWTGVASPASSDFEHISDSEFRSQPTVVSNPHYLPNRPSNLSRSLSVSRGRGSSALEGTAGTMERTPEPRFFLERTQRRMGSEAESPEGGREADGDDEQSAMEDGTDELRGRGRTRERRRGRDDDPHVKKSMLEDALRSSLATLLTLSAHPQTMSPAVSHTSLTALLGSHSPLSKSGQASPRRTFSSQLSPELNAFHRRPSPFTFATTSLPSEDETTKQKQEEMDDAQWIEPDQDSSEADVVTFTSSSSSDDGTQLAPRPTIHRSRAIPIPSTSRSRMRSNSDTSLPRPSTSFSPVASRTLNLGPSSASPPTWSRRRQHRRRGQRRSSVSPGPASIEERRTAKARLLAERGITDAEDESVEVDQVFRELVDAAKTFMGMSPRLAGSGALPSTLTGSGNNRSAGSSGTATGFSPATQIDMGMESHHWTPEPVSSPADSFPSSDPLLGSSVPTVDLSSGEDEGRRRSVSGPGSHDAGDLPHEGWFQSIFGWLRGNIEIKVWHLVGVAGVLIGIGLGAGAVLKGSRHASRLPFVTFL